MSYAVASLDWTLHQLSATSNLRSRNPQAVWQCILSQTDHGVANHSMMGCMAAEPAVFLFLGEGSPETDAMPNMRGCCIQHSIALHLTWATHERSEVSAAGAACAATRGRSSVCSLTVCIRPRIRRQHVELLGSMCMTHTFQLLSLTLDMRSWCWQARLVLSVLRSMTGHLE